MKSTATLSLNRKTVAIAGARGYSGLELTRLLLQHPGVEVAGLYATTPFDPSDSWPELKPGAMRGQALSELVDTAGQFDCVFLALPHEASAEVAPQLLTSGCNVIDLSGAFRLQEADVAANYQKWYKMRHPNPGMVKESVYGLVPFQTTTPVSQPRLIANPGCYATALSLAIIPLLKAKILDPQFVAVDAKSGTTGAGKKAEERLLFSEVADNCLPYKVGSHQHEPEIQMALSRWGGSKIDMSFTPHLLPTRRGIIASIYGKVLRGTTKDQIEGAYSEAFGNYPLARVGNIENPGLERELRLTRVVGSPRTHIIWKLEGDRVTVFSLIDNLLKGAASQAIENLNSLYGWDVSLGLTNKEGLL